MKFSETSIFLSEEGLLFVGGALDTTGGESAASWGHDLVHLAVGTGLRATGLFPISLATSLQAATDTQQILLRNFLERYMRPGDVTKWENAC
jgi:hypothetical protein